MANKGKKSGPPVLPIHQDPEMAERFEQELAWCIGQLECMIRSPSNKDKDSPRSALQILSNPKTAIVRKRQMMRQLFGDYRKHIQDEEVATRKRHNQIRIKENTQIPSTSRYFRRVQQSDSGKSEKETFSFNFEIPNSDLDEKTKET